MDHAQYIIDRPSVLYNGFLFISILSGNVNCSTLPVVRHREPVAWPVPCLMRSTARILWMSADSAALAAPPHCEGFQ